MFRKFFFKLAAIFALGILLFPHIVKAVPPPDFIFSIGSAIVQVFSVVVIFLSGIFVFLYEFIKTKSAVLRHKKAWLIIGCSMVLVIAGFVTYFLALQRQKAEYLSWLEASQKNTTLQTEQEPPVTKETPKILVTSTPQNTPLFISNDNFKSVLGTQNQNIFVLDAREDVEFENGHFPGSTHIRMADLKAGEWQQLPHNTVIYVFCWSGIRGKEVAEFLRTKNIVAVYLENGADGWYTSGGLWQGDIKFTQKFSAPEFQKVFTTDEVKKYVQNGIILVDSREPAKFKRSHIKGALNISMLSIPTKDLATAFAQVPPNSTIITICDEYVNCFDAKITGVELEKRGQEFLGRYNTPWDYGS